MQIETISMIMNTIFLFSITISLYDIASCQRELVNKKRMRDAIKRVTGRSKRQ